MLIFNKKYDSLYPIYIKYPVYLKIVIFYYLKINDSLCTYIFHILSLIAIAFNPRESVRRPTSRSQLRQIVKRRRKNLEAIFRRPLFSRETRIGEEERKICRED